MIDFFIEGVCGVLFLKTWSSAKYVSVANLKP
jgi:hypothetical protein